MNEKRFDEPKLLRIPLSSLSIQDKVSDQKKTNLRLLKQVSHGNETHESFFRIPKCKENKTPVLVQNTNNRDKILQPRLLDLRPILTYKVEESPKRDPSKVNSKIFVPKLIRLPDVNKSKEKQLLESPRRAKPKEKRPKPRDPKVFDVREEAKAKNDDSFKESKNATVQTSPRR